MNDIRENLSTILVWIYVIIAPFIADYMSQDQFVAIATAFVGLVLAIYSSYHPNTFKFLDNNEQCACEVEEVVMNDEYEC